jgi:DNA-directed RNA polymerase specialized sigma24 family protein
VTGDVTKASDAELLLGVGRLEVDALAELYRRHGASVFVLAHQLLGAARAEDATQEVFLYLWDHSDEFLGTERSLRPALLDHLRLRYLVDVDPAEGPAEDRGLTNEERAALELALAGLGYREVAGRLGLPSTVVNALLRSALTKIYDARVAPTEDSSGPG